MSAISLPYTTQLQFFATYVLYPGDSGGVLTVASVRKMKYFLKTQLWSRQVPQLS